MIRFLCAFLIGVMLPLSVNAQGVDIKVIPSPIAKEHSVITVEHPDGLEISVIYIAVNDQGVYEWRALDSDTFKHPLPTETYFGAPPGKYAVIPGGSVLVEVLPADDSGPQPQPPGPHPPDPEPTPDPDPPDPEPDPAPDGLFAKWAVVIENTRERATYDPLQVDLMFDPDTYLKLDDRGIKYRVYDEGTASGRRYQSVAGDDLPVLILMEDGENYKVFPVPKTQDELEKILRENVLR